MGIGKAYLQALLNRHRSIGVDTMAFIYHLEDHPRYAQITEAIFESWEDHVFKRVTEIEVVVIDELIADEEKTNSGSIVH